VRLEFSVTLVISGVGKNYSHELKDEYRENIRRAIRNQLHDVGFEGETIDELGTSVEELKVTG
jgi:uncharacterized protein YnzC (UPF0291/DUF896 family)